MELRLQNLSKAYSNGVRAPHNVRQTIPNGLFGLLGPNGAGKSRLMRRITLFCCLLLAALTGRAQNVNTIQFTPPSYLTSGAHILPAPGGWLVKNVIYNNDSSLVSLLRLSPSLALTRERHYRLSFRRGAYSPLLPTPHGLLGCAISNTTTSVFCFDSAYAVRWSARMQPRTNMGLLAMHDAATVVGYGGRYGNNFDRSFTQVWGPAATGATWRGKVWLSTVTGWNIGQVYAPDATGIHYLTSSDEQPTLIKLDTTKVYWSYLLNSGGTYCFTGKPGPAANGHFWLPLTVVPATNQPTVGILCRFDTAGTLLLTRRLSYTGRYLGLSDVYALPTGELLLAGYLRLGGGGKYQPMVIKLSASGALVWAHRWNVGSTGPVGGVPTLVALPGGGFRLFCTDVTFIDLDANFNGCNFVDETANIIFATSANVTRIPLPLTASPYSVPSGPDSLLTRSVPYTRAPLCTTVGLPEAAASAATSLAAWPQPLPRGEDLQLALPAGWSAPVTRLTLTSTLGQVVWRGPWTDAVTLPAHLSAGVWLLTATDARNGHTQRRRVVLE